MQTFEWIDATSVEQASKLLAASEPRATVLAKAGGMDLLDLMKEGILAPSRLINLKTIPGLDGFKARPGGDLELGTLTTLATISAAPQIRSNYLALADAAGHAATPQVRNAATIGGNLLQKPRCWYFRNLQFHASGASASSDDPAREGLNQYHAIFDNAKTTMVHASTPATALVAYDAKVELSGEGGRKRIVPIREFLLPPTHNSDRLSTIERGEVLTRVLLPALKQGTQSAYHKQTERDSYDWPICDVAVVLQLESGIVRSASIAYGWVAPTPRRVPQSERILVGKKVDEGLARQAAQAAVAGASPLSGNAYKVPVLQAVVARTILAAVKAPTTA